MKNLVVVAIALIMSSCEMLDKSPVEMSGKGMVRFSNGALTSMIDLTEFDYKGHTYISCHVRGGMSMTHAGHCKCNKTNK